MSLTGVKRGKGKVKRLGRAVARKGWFVYLLRCADGSLYAGVTNDLGKRVAAHNAGKGAKYTKPRRPVTLVWSARAKDKVAAMRREWRIKALTRAEKLALISRQSKRLP